MNNSVLQNKFEFHSLWILSVFHLIGIFLFMMPDRVAGLSFINILVCTILVLFTAIDWRLELKMLLFIFFGGILVEVIGVNSGVLFGAYAYGNELGPKILGVPVVLGFNWYCVVAASAHLSRYVLKDVSVLISSLVSACLCTFLDFVIEPVAMANDFWDWEVGYVPVFNYICWFVFSFIFSIVYFKKIKIMNKTAVSLFFIWFLFFALLNFI